MKAEINWEPFSWDELRALYYLWKYQRSLVCEGTTWSIYGDFRLVVAPNTIESLSARGCIARLKKYDEPFHDDYGLTPFGQSWIERCESDYLAQLQQRIDHEIGWKE